MAIGAIGNDGNGSLAGHVRVYELNARNTWAQLGRDIDGEAAGDQSGYDRYPSRTVAAGWPSGLLDNDGNGSDAGHVRIFSIGLGLLDINPSPNALDAPANTPISFVFSDSVLASTVNRDHFHFFGEQSGCLTGSFRGGGTDSIVFTPDTALFPGEVVRVTVDSGVLGLDSSRLDNPQSYEFRVKSGTIPDPAFASRLVSDTATQAYGVFAADIDDDGDIDILSASGGNDRIAWYENLGGGRRFRGHTISDSADDARAVHAADLDCDGDMDVLSASFDDQKIALYRNDGSENFTETIIDTSLDGAVQLMTADADRDGDLDVLAVGANRPGVVAWYLQDTSGNFTKSVVDTALSGAFSIHASDLDGDGDMDMLAVGERTDALLWYENDGNQNYTVDTLSTNFDDPRDVYAADFDGDGDQDIVVAASQFDIIAFLRNDGNQNFTQDTITQNADFVYDLHAADMDGDGDADVIAASLSDDRVRIFDNDGQGNFTERIVTQSADGAVSVYPADIDGDGILDIVSAARNGNQIVWHKSIPRPYISVVGAGMPITQGDTIPAIADSTDLGIAYVGGDTVRVRYQLFNKVDDTLVLGGQVRVDPPGNNAFSVAVPPDDTLAPGDSTFFVLDFAPSDTGRQRAGVFIPVRTVKDTLTFAIAGTGRPCPALQANARITDAACASNTDGAIDLSPSGGVSGPYRFAWADGPRTQNRRSLGAGSYPVVIADSAGCADTFTYRVNEPAPLRLTARLEPVTCPGGSDGRIVTSVQGGTPSYRYQWNSGPGEPSLDSLTVGTYRLTVRDSNNCRLDTSFQIIQRDTIAPVARARTDTFELDSSGRVSVDPRSLEAGSTDNCVIDRFALSRSQFSCVDTGRNAVTFIVFDPDGNKDSVNTTIVVRDRLAPRVEVRNRSFQLDASGQLTIQGNQFDDGSTDNCGIDTFVVRPRRFDCGDLGPNPVTVTAIDAAGNRDSATAMLTIRALDLPRPDFGVLKSCVNDTVLLRDLSTIGASSVITRFSIDWDGDGQYDTTRLRAGTRVGRRLPDTGLQAIGFRARAANGCVVDTQKTIRIHPAPEPGFTAQAGCAGSLVLFRDTSRIARGRIQSVAFDFQGDGTFDRQGLGPGATVNFRYDSPGVRKVGIRATSDQGCQITAVEAFGVNPRVQVDPNPQPDFSYRPACAYDSLLIRERSRISSGTIDSLAYDLDNDGVYEYRGGPGKTFAFTSQPGAAIPSGYWPSAIRAVWPCAPIPWRCTPYPSRTSWSPAAVKGSRPRCAMPPRSPLTPLPQLILTWTMTAATIPPA